MATPAESSKRIDPRQAGLENWLNVSFSRELTGVYDDLKLDPVRQVLAALPTQPPAPVTVAGTKGKGSTIAFLERILLAHDRQTLAFTSPHVSHICERWRLNGEPVSLTAAEAAAAVVAEAEQRCHQDLTYFERCFLIACVIAANQSESVFLCEVGLGGRLDCANALDCQIAILTHLSHDHCHVLGHELHQIAHEKLAISRPQQPLLIAPQSKDAQDAIQRELPSERQIEWIQPLTTAHRLGLPGAHQLGNAATALRAAELLGVPLTQEHIDKALSNTHLAARCQLVTHEQRQALIDGAHNGPSIAATLATAKHLLQDGWWLILGCATDKDLPPILAAIANAIGDHPRILRCGYTGPRARLAQNWDTSATAWPWHDTISSAIAAIPDTADYCVTGSFYLAAEALKGLNAAEHLNG